MWQGTAQTHTIKCSAPAQKHVHLNLADNLGDALQLPTDLPSFLKWPEEATDVQSNAQCPLVPSATGSQNLLKRDRNWWHPTTAVATGGARSKYPTMLDPVEHPQE